MQCARHICIGTYVNNVKCMYTSTCSHIVSCTEFIGIYTYIIVSCVHELIGICDISMALEGHICGLHINDYSIENKSCNLVLLNFFIVWLVGTVMWGLYIDYIIKWHDKKSYIAVFLIILTKGKQWCHWQCCWHHMMPMPAQMVTCFQKSHVVLHFNCLDLRIAMVPLTTLLVSHDLSITWFQHNYQMCQWHTSQVALHFNCCWPKECIGVIDDTIGIILYWCQH